MTSPGGGACLREGGRAILASVSSDLDERFHGRPRRVAQARNARGAVSVRLDVRTCLLQRTARPDGVFGEPAFWIYPPPLCRRLRERGAEVVRILPPLAGSDHRSLLQREEVISDQKRDPLLELAMGDGPVPEQLWWTPRERAGCRSIY
jgi:hypothetical protein